MSLESDLNQIEKRLERIEQKLGLYSAPGAEKALEEWVENQETRVLQQVLREIDAKDLVLALMGFGPKAVLQVKNAMSKTGWNMLKDDMAYQLKTAVHGSAREDARLKVMNIIQLLADRGEVQAHPPGRAPEDPAGRKKKQEEEKEEMNRKLAELERWKKENFDSLD